MPELKLRAKPEETDPAKKLEAAQAESAPKRRGRPPGSHNRVSRRSASLETQIGATLTTLNFVVMLTPFRGDALDTAEITALARGIDAQCKVSPTFRKYVELALTAGSGGQLLMVVAMIGARRAARHGMIPEYLDGTIGAMLETETGKAATTPEPTPEPEPQNGKIVDIPGAVPIFPTE